MVLPCLEKYHHSSFQFSKAVDDSERVITLEKKGFGGTLHGSGMKTGA